jgi:lipid A ethanolaminephosphotransferase
MLTGLDTRVQEIMRGKATPGALVVLHQLGSHGPAYYLRSPANLKAFTPECKSRALSDCDRQHVVNAYDNSILYTDTFLAQTIAFLKAQAARYDTALIYVSDHGESLGESNLYLHGMPYPLAPRAQKHVPMIVWLSDALQARRDLSTACLQARRGEPLTHDNLFHSMMGVLDLESSIVQARLNLFASCTGSFTQRP